VLAVSVGPAECDRLTDNAIHVDMQKNAGEYVICGQDPPVASEWTVNNCSNRVTRRRIDRWKLIGGHLPQWFLDLGLSTGLRFQLIGSEKCGVRL
jgi:hypothetical protein